MAVKDNNFKVDKKHKDLRDSISHSNIFMEDLYDLNNKNYSEFFSYAYKEMIDFLKSIDEQIIKDFGYENRKSYILEFNRSLSSLFNKKDYLWLTFYDKNEKNISIEKIGVNMSKDIRVKTLQRNIVRNKIDNAIKGKVFKQVIKFKVYAFMQYVIREAFYKAKKEVKY